MSTADRIDAVADLVATIEEVGYVVDEEVRAGVSLNAHPRGYYGVELYVGIPSDK